MARHKIDTAPYVRSHGSDPKPGQFGLWILKRKNGDLEISRTCYWRELRNQRFDFEWVLLP